MGAPNPMQGVLLQALMQKIAGGAQGQPDQSVQGAGMAGQPGGGSPGGGGGMTVASSGDDQGDALSKELSIMRVADPNMVSQKLDDINKMFGALIAHTNRSLPGVALGLSKALTGLHTAIREANKAAQAMAVAAPPIATSALPPSFAGGGGGTGPGAGGPAQPGMGS